MRRPALAILVLAACVTGHGRAPAPPPPGPEPASPAVAAATGAPSAPAAPDARPPGPRAAPADLPPPLPPPLPAPEPPSPAAVEPADPMEVLWSHRLHFMGREPLVTIRIAEGRDEIALRARGPARLLPRGGASVALAAGTRLRVRAVDARPASLAWAPLLAEASFDDRAALDEARRRWAARGIASHARVVGGVYGIGGRVVDNRRELLLADGDGTEAGARAAAEALRVPLDARVVARPVGTLEVLAEDGAMVASADAALAVEVEGEAGFVVERAEDRAGGAGEDRAYGGRLFVTVDARGRLAAVHAVALEELLRGLVPSEMPSSVHAEALKAQAVTARSNVLAQIGRRHETDPYMLCAEVHCQSYLGQGVHGARTDAAVRATAGEALFRDRRLVDAVYSALCGGHGEDNDAVWGNAPDPSLRGRPDVPAAEAARAGGLADEARLRTFLARPPDAWCARPRAGRPDRFRWERRLSAAELDAAVAPLGVGAGATIEVRARGVSGRARVLRVRGDAGEADVSGELRIRRLLRNLPSSMFVVDREGDGVVLRGGGWGHGAGMCQWGAVGRAEAGQDYRAILRAYYSGAEVARIY